jgi:type VI secretion system protein VasD
MRCAGLALCLSIAPAGCALFGRSERSEALTVTVHAADRLNPDELGRSLPTLVRVYQLKKTDRIEAAGYDALYRDDRAALADDLLQVDELVVSPSTTTARTLTRAPGATAVAVVAVVRRPSGDEWRSVVPLPRPGKGAPIDLRLEGYRVSR